MTKFRISSVARQYFWIERDLVVVIIGVKRKIMGRMLLCCNGLQLLWYKMWVN